MTDFTVTGLRVVEDSSNLNDPDKTLLAHFDVVIMNVVSIRGLSLFERKDGKFILHSPRVAYTKDAPAWSVMITDAALRVRLTEAAVKLYHQFVPPPVVTLNDLLKSAQAR